MSTRDSTVANHITTSRFSLNASSLSNERRGIRCQCEKPIQTSLARTRSAATVDALAEMSSPSAAYIALLWKTRCCMASVARVEWCRQWFGRRRWQCLRRRGKRLDWHRRVPLLRKRSATDQIALKNVVVELVDVDAVAVAAMMRPSMPCQATSPRTGRSGCSRAVTLFEMDILDRHCVLGQSPVILAFGIGQPTLGIELQVEQPRFLDVIGLPEQSRERLQPAVGGDSAIVVRHCHLIRAVGFGHCVAQVADDLLFLLHQDHPVPRQLQFGIAYCRVSRREPMG